MRYNMVHSVGGTSGGAGGISPDQEFAKLWNRLIAGNKTAANEVFGTKGSAPGSVTPETLAALNNDMRALNEFAKANVLYKSVIKDMLKGTSGGLTYEEALTSTENMTKFVKGSR